VTADVDRVLYEMRSRVFNGDRTIADVLADLDQDLPTFPQVNGPAETLAPLALESVLREVQPLYPAATAVTITTTDTHLSVTLTGAPPEDPTLLKEAAGDHDATATFDPDHITIEWSTAR
jgi:hypothetical protein